ncbi:MAG TPA: CBS domain-containing protein [Actinomycetota bacterium]
MALLVRHVMSEEPKAARPDMTVADAAGLMRSFDVGAIPLVEGEELVGLVTDRDLVVRVLAHRSEPADVRLGDIATTATITVSPDVQVAVARELMAERRIRRLPVTKDGRLVGIVSLGDIALADASTRAVGETLQEISESESTRTMNDGPDPGTPDRVKG